MSRHKWIIGGIGFITGGPLGSLAMLALEKVNFGTSKTGVIIEADKKSEILEGQRNGFLFSLMVLSSYIIQADKNILDEEQRYVIEFVKKYYGDAAAKEAETTLQKLFLYSLDYRDQIWEQKIQGCCNQLTDYLTEEQLRLLLSFLIKICKADFDIANEEIAALYKVAKWLNVSNEDIALLEKEKEDSLIESYDSVFMMSDLI